MKELFNSIITIEQQQRKESRIRRVNALAVLIWYNNKEKFLEISELLIYPEGVVFHKEYDEYKPASRKQIHLKKIGNGVIEDKELIQEIENTCTKYKDIKTKELCTIVNDKLGNPNEFENFYKVFNP